MYLWLTTLDLPFSIYVCMCVGVLKVMYSDTGVGLDSGVVAADDEEEEEEGEDECCGLHQEEKKENWILWDMKRPLEGNCKLQLLKFDSDEAKHVFWHSSAHILGKKEQGYTEKRGGRRYSLYRDLCISLNVDVSRSAFLCLWFLLCISSCVR